MAALNYPGPFCEQVGILTDALTASGDISTLPTIEVEEFNKGVVLELNEFRKNNNIPWEQFYSWIKQLCCDIVPSLHYIQVKINRIEGKLKQFKRNKLHDALLELKSEAFFGNEVCVHNEQCPKVGKTKAATVNSFDMEVLSMVNHKLAAELTSTKESLDLEQAKTDQLSEKLSKLSIRNVNKRLRRRDNQIVCLKEQVKEKVKIESNLENAEKVSKRLQVNLCYAKKRCKAIADECQALSTHAQIIDEKVIGLREALDDVRSERDFLIQRVEELESHTFETKDHKMKYLDSVRQCCIELLAMNVGIKNVDPVIRCVLKHIVSIEVKELPHSTSLVRMFAEMKGLACQQLAEELSEQDNLTLHSDGTSKYGQHYYSFQISTQDSAYSLGMAEMLTGSTTQVLHTFKQILSDVELVAGPNSGKLILSRIKNTMSDRHVVEKKFNEVLEDYRNEILPTIVQSWEQMTPDEQGSISTLNNFFCGMHVVVGMADTVSSVLLRWESAHFDKSVGAAVSCAFVKKTESGIVRLVRTACKALCKHGSEQSGVYQAFTSYLSSNGIKRNPLASFRGNRFNILFYDAGVLYYISDFIKSFFKDVWQTPNQLLRAVYSDIQVPEFLAGCRALGLVNKIVTGPLWRVLESSDISITEMNVFYQTLVSYIEEWSLDASKLLCGEAVLFPDFPPSEDAVWHHLTTASESDSTTQEILQIIFHAFSALLTRLLSDHLPGGVHDNPCAQLQEETKSVPKTNVISERDFGQLDRLLREKPNASTLSLEAMVLFSNNKTAQWLNSKPQAEVKVLLQKARNAAPEFKQLYADRRKQMQEERTQLLKAKQQALQAAKEKALRQKEQLTQEIVQCGLWQTHDDIMKGLAMEKSKSAKIKALKAQLNFRRRVLEQQHPDKEVFAFSRKGKQLSVDELVSNLEKLLSTSPLQDRHAAENQQSLIGKTIRHKWCNEDGEEQWYTGHILSAVEGSTEWFNVRYDGEEGVLTLNLYEDIENGDLDIVA